MLIPAEGENFLCLVRAVVLYREDNHTRILHEDGTSVITSFTPQTLKKRGEALWEKSAVSTRSWRFKTDIFSEELHTIDG